MKKFLMTLIAVVLIAAVLLFVGKDWLIKTVAETAVTTVTGFKTQIGFLKVQLPSTVHIKDLEIDNPAGFKEKIFTKIPEIYVSLDFQKLLRGEMVHLREVRLNLSEVNIEKNKEGVSNVSLLSTVAQKPGAAEAKPEAAKKEMPFRIDLLVLSMGNVRYADRSSLVPVNLSTNLNINQERIEGVQSPMALVNLILLKIVQGTTFGNIGLSPDMLKGSLQNAFSSGEDLLKGTAASVTDQAKGLTDVAAGLGTEGSQALGGTVSGAKGAIGGLWGKVKSTVTASDSGDSSNP